MSQSDRAGGRVRDLRDNVLARLRGHAPLTDRLEQVDSVDDGTDVIQPAPSLGDDDHDVVLAVSVVTESSQRENLQERKNMTIQTELRIRDPTLKAQGITWHDELLDEIAAVLTSHADGWTAQGVTGGTPDPLWDDDLNRHRSVRRVDVEHWG